MAFQFKGFSATRPLARMIDKTNCQYEAFFIYYDPAGKKHSYRCKKGINNLPRSQRILQAKAMADVLWEGLHKGWNPLKDGYPNFARDVQTDLPLTFSEALDFAIQKKEEQLSKYSLYDYRGCVRFMKKAAKETGYHNINIKLIQRKDIRLIVATAKEDRSWSNNARNKYLSILRGLLSVLVDEEKIEYNPAFKIKEEPVVTGPGYKTVTDEEKETIAGHLMAVAPDYFEYLMFIYDDGIRRKETLMLQVKDINLNQSEIMIRPEVAKTNRARVVPITDTIMQILLRREIWKYPPDHYIFSNNKFMPGAVPYHPNTPTSWWKDLVIDGLGIPCKMYSLKHKGADDKILADVDLEALRTLYGHKSSQMTEVYARAIKGRYKQQIIDKSPGFAKVVQMKRKAK